MDFPALHFLLLFSLPIPLVSKTRVFEGTLGPYNKASDQQNDNVEMRQGEITSEKVSREISWSPTRITKHQTTFRATQTTIRATQPPRLEIYKDLTAKDLTVVSSQMSLTIKWTIRNNHLNTLRFQYREALASKYSEIYANYSEEISVIDNLTESTYYVICLSPSARKILDEDCIIRSTLVARSENLNDTLVYALPPSFMMLGLILGIVIGYYLKSYRDSKKPVALRRPSWTIVEKYLKQHQSSGTASYISFPSRRATKTWVIAKPNRFNRSNSSPPVVVRASAAARPLEMSQREYIEFIETTFDEHFYQYLQFGALQSTERPSQVNSNPSYETLKFSSLRRQSTPGTSSSTEHSGFSRRNVGLENIYEEVPRPSNLENGRETFRL